MKKILLNIPERIETPRLRLTMPTAGNGEAVHQAIMDGYEDYVEWLNWVPDPPTVEEVEEDCRKQHAEFILRDAIRYLIWEKSSKTVIGRCALPPDQAYWEIPQFGLSYFIRQSKRSNGFASEAVHALGHMAFSSLKARKLEIYVDSENVSSARVALNLGFTHEFTHKGRWPRSDGKLCDLRAYSIFSPEDLLLGKTVEAIKP